MRNNALHHILVQRQLLNQSPVVIQHSRLSWFDMHFLLRNKNVINLVEDALLMTSIGDTHLMQVLSFYITQRRQITVAVLNEVVVIFLNLHIIDKEQAHCKLFYALRKFVILFRIWRQSQLSHLTRIYSRQRFQRRQSVHVQNCTIIILRQIVLCKKIVYFIIVLVDNMLQSVLKTLAIFACQNILQMIVWILCSVKRCCRYSR
mmetsp:Transcript_40065/g.65699  ORF Transcript_40065/g.65699 Transcript_40065/m.65699 type:complete len:204 (+) Transcript_40065:865-1476(+)